MAFMSALLPMAASTLSFGSGGLGAITSIVSGNYQSAVAKNNAQIAERNAEAASRAAQEEAQRSDIESAAERAALYAQQAVSGIDTGSRSSVTTRALSARTGRLAAKDISSAGNSAAQRLKQDAANFRGAAKQARLQGYLGAASSLMNSATKAFSGGMG